MGKHACSSSSSSSSGLVLVVGSIQALIVALNLPLLLGHAVSEVGILHTDLPVIDLPRETGFLPSYYISLCE